MAKPVRFHGDSKDRLRRLPIDARSDLGYQLYQVELGREPSNWKPMSTVGRGVREIRVRDVSGAYRAIYLATLSDAVHVYHVFQKKTRKTNDRDLEIARQRYQEHMRSLK